MESSICAGVSFKEVSGLENCNFIKKWLQKTCFYVNFAKFLRTPIVQNICSLWIRLEEEEEYKNYLRITPEYFNELFVLVKDTIIK